MSATLTDDHLVDDLRERGLVGPISPDFLAEYRQHRLFVEAVKKIERTPGAPERMHRALVQLGIIPAEDRGDERLLAAWAAFREGLNEYEANGPDAPAELDALPEARFDAADDVICEAPATTLEGALVKLRRAVGVTEHTGWVERALSKGDDTTLFARVIDLDYEGRLIVDAIAAIELVRREAMA